MTSSIICRILSLFIAFVFMQSLFYHFTGSAETQYIIATLEKWAPENFFIHYGPFILASLELLASWLLFTRWRFYGAFIASIITTVMICVHLFTPVGIKLPVFNQTNEVVGNDGGLFFFLICLVFFSSLLICLLTIVKRYLHNKLK